MISARVQSEIPSFGDSTIQKKTGDNRPVNAFFATLNSAVIASTPDAAGTDKASFAVKDAAPAIANTSVSVAADTPELGSDQSIKDFSDAVFPKAANDDLNIAAALLAGAHVIANLSTKVGKADQADIELSETDTGSSKLDETQQAAPQMAASVASASLNLPFTATTYSLSQITIGLGSVKSAEQNSTQVDGVISGSQNTDQPGIENGKAAFNLGSSIPKSTDPAFQSIASKPDLAAPQAIADRQLDLARDSRWLDSLAREIADVKGANGHLQFNLAPARLGRLEIALQTSDSGLSVSMKVQSNEAAAILSAAQPKFVEELRTNGVRVIGSDVSTQDSASQRDSPSQHRPEHLIEHNQVDAAQTKDKKSKSQNGRFA
jgi:flagellar hook-length control protein FliK